MFHTQFDTPTIQAEKHRKGSLVSQVPVRDNSNQVLDFLMSGRMIDASRFGYDFRDDEGLPDVINAYNTLGMDITEKINIYNAVSDRLEEFKKNSKKEAIEPIDWKQKYDEIHAKYVEKPKEPVVES